MRDFYKERTFIPSPYLETDTLAQVGSNTFLKILKIEGNTGL